MIHNSKLVRVHLFYLKDQSTSQVSSFNAHSSKVPSGRYRRTRTGSRPCANSFFAISSASISVPTSTITFAPWLICAARALNTRAFSNFVRYGLVTRASSGSDPSNVRSETKCSSSIILFLSLYVRHNQNADDNLLFLFLGGRLFTVSRKKYDASYKTTQWRPSGYM